MADSLILAAAVLAGLWCFVHLIMGGREVAQPLLAAASLDPMVRHVQYICWHFTSVTIALMATFFALAYVTGVAAYAVCGLLLSTGFVVVGIGLVVKLGLSHSKHPQGWLFVPVALLGLGGVLL